MGYPQSRLFEEATRLEHERQQQRQEMYFARNHAMGQAKRERERKRKHLRTLRSVSEQAREALVK